MQEDSGAGRRGGFGLALRLEGVPGHDELAVRLEPGVAVKLDRRRVVGPGPHVAERDPTLGEQPDRLPDEHLADAPPPVPFGDIKLGNLTLQPSAWVVEDDP